MADKYTDFQIPETGYVTFDAESLRDLIIQRLNAQGTFTDQIYQGSNMSSFIDVIAYSYHVLMYYLNRTSTETLFSETTIYENVNRIVKLLNYNPIGYQTSTLNFNAFATEDLVPGSYTIPRYTYVVSNSIAYSLDADVSFTKNTDTDEPIEIIGDKYLLYQGMWVEHPEIISYGQDFETHLLLPAEKETTIDHFHVHVYVKDSQTGIYNQYTETSSLYLNGPNDRVFEKRFSENENYEIKFGNNINGARPLAGDVIQIYYLESKGEAGQVGPNFLDDLKIAMFGTTKFGKIKNDIKPENIRYITFDNLEAMYFTNDTQSTISQQRETVEEMKRKAPLHLASQDRLVTINEYSTFIDKNFGNMLTSSKIIDNDTYIDGHMKYLSQDIGIENPNLESRVMFNHYKASTSTHFNNVYIYCVPKISKNTSSQIMTNFLTQSQKELITNMANPKKMLSHEIVLVDPVYVGINLGVVTANEIQTANVTDNTILEITKESTSLRDDDAIIQQVNDLILNYFDNVNCSLGQLIDLNVLGSSILEVDGVDSIHTSRTDIDLRSPGLSMLIWNPVYTNDVTITNQNIKLPDFKFPYVYDSFNLYKKINIVK